MYVCFKFTLSYTTGTFAFDKIFPNFDVDLVVIVMCVV